jgi:IS1 family transposase
MSTPNRSSPTRPGPSWGKKDKHCDPLDPDDAERGSYWDHVIVDPETKLIVSLVVGRRDADTVVQLFTDFYGRTDGYLPELICTDEYAVYRTVILDTYGVLRDELELTPQEEAEFRLGDFHFPVEVTYATVHKQKEGGRVVAVSRRLVLGSEERLEQTLEDSERSGTVNTSFVERYHGTQRHFNARKKRRAYTFSKELGFHEAATWLVVLWYNFGWCVRTLREKVQEDPPRYHYRTPAVAAGLTDHAWTMEELLCYPLYPPTDPRPAQPPRTYKDILQRLKGVIDASEKAHG